VRLVQAEIAVDEVSGGVSQADLASIAVFNDLGERLTIRAVGFMEKNVHFSRREHNNTGLTASDRLYPKSAESSTGMIRSKEPWGELVVAERQRLLCGEKEPFGFVDLMRVYSGRRARAVSRL
jgi:hypothetical protein